MHSNVFDGVHILCLIRIIPFHSNLPALMPKEEHKRGIGFAS